MNCKQGDLAIIVNVTDKRFTDNIGKIVRCVTLWGIAENYGPMWHIHAEGAPLHICDIKTKEHSFAADALHSDHNLRPIKGEKEVRDEEIIIPADVKSS